jgi:excisionase family DNA binding protein
LQGGETNSDYCLKESFMTILTIEEAARFLRVSRRTLYRLKDIPRVRYAGKLVYVKEDLEVWVRGRMEGGILPSHSIPVEMPRLVRHHRNALYQIPTSRISR